MPLNPKETLEHRDLFEYYYSLPPESRSYAAVAEHFANKEIEGRKVTESRIQSWAKKFHWSAMVHARDSNVADAIDEQMTLSIADQKAALVEKNQKVINEWFKQKMENADEMVATLANIPPRDMLKFMQFQYELLEKQSPTDNNAKEDKGPDFSKFTPDELRGIVKTVTAGSTDRTSKTKPS
ncbi:MAG: hypothetical protein JRN15_21210 [Nitrososphaerota archaeon]|nr:hypothetical protein [Nitrososphaerota archaeon]